MKTPIKTPAKHLYAKRKGQCHYDAAAKSKSSFSKVKASVIEKMEQQQTPEKSLREATEKITTIIPDEI